MKLYMSIYSTVSVKSQITKYWSCQMDSFLTWIWFVHLNDMFNFFVYVRITYHCISTYLCELGSACFEVGSWIFSKIEQQNVERRTFVDIWIKYAVSLQNISFSWHANSPCNIYIKVPILIIAKMHIYYCKFKNVISNIQGVISMLNREVYCSKK